jgi:hypothetical protein
MTHDPLCPNIPCTCEPDEYGHIPTCDHECLCILITLARRHEREVYARHLDLLAIEYDYMNPTENSEIVWTLNEVIRILKADEGYCCREDDN